MVLRRDAEQNRQRILRAAREMFAAHGVDVTLDDIAAHADVSVATVYRRYPDRESLVEALFDDRLDQLAGWAAEALEVPDPWDGLSGFLTRATEAIASDRGLRDVLFSGVYGKTHVAEKRRRLQPLSEALVARCAGLLRPGVTGVDVGVIHYLMGSVLEYTQATDPDLWRRYLTMLLDGLRAGGGALPHPAPDPDTMARITLGWHPNRR